MYFTRDPGEFFKKNRKDLKNIILRFFRNLIVYEDYQDIEAGFFEHMCNSKLLEKFDETKSKFITYLIRCLRNHLLGKFNQLKYQNWHTKTYSLTNDDILLDNDDGDSSSKLDYLLGGKEDDCDFKIDCNILLSKLKHPQERKLFKKYIEECRDQEVANDNTLNSRTSAGVACVKRKLRHSLRNYI